MSVGLEHLLGRERDRVLMSREICWQEKPGIPVEEHMEVCRWDLKGGTFVDDIYEPCTIDGAHSVVFVLFLVC